MNTKYFKEIILLLIHHHPSLKGMYGIVQVLGRLNLEMAIDSIDELKREELIRVESFLNNSNIINSDRVFFKGYNDTKPLIAGAKTEEEHSKNRRTEFVILKNDFKQ